MSTSKFCAECGKPVKSENAVVCIECGASIASSQVNALAQKKWGQGTIIFLYLMAFFMPLIGGIGGLIGLFNPLNRQHGGALIALSFFFWIIWAAVFLGMAGLGI